jgi:hypothetical protein
LSQLEIAVLFTDAIDTFSKFIDIRSERIGRQLESLKVIIQLGCSLLHAGPDCSSSCKDALSILDAGFYLLGLPKTKPAEVIVPAKFNEIISEMQ